MRNDARPIGEESPASPLGGEHGDARDSVAHDRQSHIVNEEAEERFPQDPGGLPTPSSEPPAKD